jgi:hypothetical protein
MTPTNIKLASIPAARVTKRNVPWKMTKERRSSIVRDLKQKHIKTKYKYPKTATKNTYYQIDVEVLTASNLPTDRDVMDTSDPYCKIKIGSMADQTNVIFNINEKEKVVWNECMVFIYQHKVIMMYHQMI